jgi:hypothetical protein
MLIASLDKNSFFPDLQRNLFLFHDKTVDPINLVSRTSGGTRMDDAVTYS